eukprot:1024020_1
MDTELIQLDDIDNILDEIEDNERKRNCDIDWQTIAKEISNENIKYIKDLISSKDIGVNEQNPSNGFTLLMYAVVIGNYDLVKAICNSGADISINDKHNNNALYYAIKYGRYKITELLYYRQLSSLGNDLKTIMMTIRDKNEEAQIFKEVAKQEEMRLFSFNQCIIQCLKNRRPLSGDMLYFAWYFECNGKPGYEGIGMDPMIRPFESQLWIQLMKTYEEILCDTSDVQGWKWMKQYILPSLIWYLPHPLNIQNEPNEDHDGDGTDDMEQTLKKTLFYELLVRVRRESKRQSDLLLKGKIDKIKAEKPEEWNQLISYKLSTKYSEARQDSCGDGCLLAAYSADDLSEDKYPSSTHFIAKKHYDTNVYLSLLLFRANIMDNTFQKDMKRITNEIRSASTVDVSCRAGPVKTLTRSQAKVENDYINEKWPTSAKILDINRCALQFESTSDMMKYIRIFTERIQSNQAYCVVALIRCKNGWSVYNPDYPTYTDIKLNVLIKSKGVGSVIAEIQFLLSLMSAYKKVAHKLYSTERKFEMVYNFKKMALTIAEFNDFRNLNEVFIHLIKNDDLAGIRTLFDITGLTRQTLIQVDFEKKDRHDLELYRKVPLSHAIQLKKGTINQYFATEQRDLYLNSLYDLIQKYWTEELFRFDNIFSDIMEQYLALLPNRKELSDLLNTDKFLVSVCKNSQSFPTVLNADILDHQSKLDLLSRDSIVHVAFSLPDSVNALAIYEYMKKEQTAWRKMILQQATSRGWQAMNPLMCLCQNGHSNGVIILQELFQDPSIDDPTKMSWIKQESKAIGKLNLFNYASYNKNDGYLCQIISYLKNEPSVLYELAAKKNQAKDFMSKYVHDNCICKLLEYFAVIQPKYVSELLNVNGQWSDPICLIDMIEMFDGDDDTCPDGYRKSVEFVLNCDCLSQQYKLNLCQQWDKNKHFALLVLKYARNDRDFLLKCINHRHDGKTLLQYDIAKPSQETLNAFELVLKEDKVLSAQDKIDLICDKTPDANVMLLQMACKSKREMGTEIVKTIVDVLKEDPAIFRSQLSIPGGSNLLIQIMEREYFIDPEWFDKWCLIMDSIEDKQMKLELLNEKAMKPDFDGLVGFEVAKQIAAKEKYNGYLKKHGLAK